MRTFTVFVWACVLSLVNGSAIQSGVDCGSKLYIDEALVRFSSDEADVYVLQGRNTNCHKCSWSDVATANTCRSVRCQASLLLLLISACSTLFTPHEWHLRVLDITNGGVVASRDYLFGEHGEYELIFASTGGGLQIVETKGGINSLKPLVTFIGVLIAFIFLCFFIPFIDEKFKIRKMFNADRTEAQEALLPSGEGQRAKAESEGRVPAGSAKKPARLHSLDTFRGLTLCLMIFVNYGGGGYWFFEHADWHGLTFADLLFPWFMWMMGVSMALSFEAMAVKNVPIGTLWRKMLRRTFILFWLGMFLANGYELKTWRIPGVLQYFSVSYFLVCSTVLMCHAYTKSKIADIMSSEKRDSEILQNWQVHPEDRYVAFVVICPLSLKPVCCRGIFGSLCYPRPSTILTAYRLEWVIQLALVIIYMAVTLGGKAPGCPRYVLVIA